MRLDDFEKGLLAGEGTRAQQLSMKLLLAVGEGSKAERFIPITHAHIDSCLYHGQAGLDYAQMMVESEGKVSVPTTLNVSSLDLVHPDLFQGEVETAVSARALMDAYLSLGCQPTWTCAPYQNCYRPEFGAHIAWAESNAIVFANSVLGARTARYGDFTDIAAAIVGRVPEAGLHLDQNRQATIILNCSTIANGWWERDDVAGLLGFWAGKLAGSGVPALVGVEAEWTEDDLKLLGAAAASTGAVGLFHVIGQTPEASNFEAVVHTDQTDLIRHVEITDQMLEEAIRSLSSSNETQIDVVSIGTPHASAAEISAVAVLLRGRKIHPRIKFYLSTGREMLAPDSPVLQEIAILEEAGVQIVTDTCTYITPILDQSCRTAMTNSVKWAYYAPGNLGISVVLGTLAECIETAISGELNRSPLPNNG